MACIALVDDDGALLEVLALAISAAGHRVLTATCGATGLELARRDEVELLIADVNMPALDGFSLCRTLRQEGRALPIILLTSREGEIDEALGLDLGADDFITKPCSNRVLLARIEALLRRSALRAGDSCDTGDTETVLQRGPLRIDRERLELRLRDQLLEVTVTELRLLEALAGRPGVVFSRERLLELAREDDSVVTPRVIDTYVARLRRKFKAVRAGDEGLIETVVGAGYRLRDDARGA